ncbi:piggyBac transposable element-derived protein 4-like [Xyrichtys novacula]|uniref:PiggyBac transposable element-derived protein 4-like n=1 Tax=Xyrichtys novacula TaxID=13765 RepID=A0AAV1HDE8_XYRNO|nr:piggyBac transposable element-derived protein 4-like [Xyrichtys novacula]
MSREFTALQVMRQMLSNAFSDDANPDEEAEGVSEEEDYEATYDKQERGRKDRSGEATPPPSPHMPSSPLPPSTGPPGPTEYSLVHARDIASAFFMFVTPSIERIILEMTNLEGRRKIGDGWKRMDAVDLRAYMGLMLLAGVYRSRGMATASLWDAESGRSIFRATMPLKVFHAYSRLLRFDDRESRPARRATDKLAAVREVWDAWSERLPSLYNPGPEITVDEQLLRLEDASVHGEGRGRGRGPEKNLGMRVVLDVTEGLRDRNVTCDNFFTSYELGQQLLKRNMTMVDTFRKNKPELPPALLSPKGRAVFSSKFAFMSTTAAVSYVPKKNKNVLLVSTKHTEAGVSDRRDRKPVIILDYNRCKGGVDNLDKVIGTYSCRRMTARWPLVVFHNILDVSSYNAFVIWRELNPEWMPQKRNKRRVFLERLGKALVTPLIERRERLPRTAASAAVVRVVRSAASRSRTRGEGEGATGAASGADGPTGARKRKRCQFCPRAKDNKTSTVCSGRGMRSVELSATGVTSFRGREAAWQDRIRRGNTYDFPKMKMSRELPKRHESMMNSEDPDIEVVGGDVAAIVASDTSDCPTSNSAYADSTSRSDMASPSPTSIRPDNTVSVNDDDYCEEESDEREEGSRCSDERRAARDFYRDADSPRSRYEYDDYRSDAAELDVGGRFGEDEAWENNPDEERDRYGWLSRRRYRRSRFSNSFADQRELFDRSDERRTPRDSRGASDRDADFYRDSDSPRSRRQYDDYRSDAAELEVEGRFGEDEAWRNAPDEEYECRGLLSERHVEGDVVEDEECYPYGDSLGTPGDAEDTGEADLPRDGFMGRSELLNDEICIALWDCEEEVREEFGSNDRYAATCRWTELEESWKSFVGWLGERWWGSVSEESVRTFMDSSERRRVGDIVVSACFGDTPGGVCSFTVKTESGLLSLPLLIRRRRYVCADLAEGDFSCPIDMLRKLARETYTHLLPRPTTIPSDPQSFSLTRVVDDMWSVLELVKSGWCDVSRPHRIIQYLQNKEGPSVTPAALICCVDDDSPGYLFEIIDAKGKSLKVTFDKWGFTFGSGLHFSGLTSLLSHICEVDGVHFVINCRFLLTASEPERPM